MSNTALLVRMADVNGGVEFVVNTETVHEGMRTVTGSLNGFWGIEDGMDAVTLTLPAEVVEVRLANEAPWGWHVHLETDKTQRWFID